MTQVMISADTQRAYRNRLVFTTALCGTMLIATPALADSYGQFGSTTSVSAGVSLTYTPNSNLLVVGATQNGIVNWDSLNVPSGHQLYYTNQNGISASPIAILNRVANGKTQIDGSFGGIVGDNVSVYLINPNGIVFGAGSSVNVGSLVASTLDVSDADFLDGDNKLTFKRGATLPNGIEVRPGASLTATGTQTGMGKLVLLGSYADVAGTLTSKGETAVVVADDVTTTLGDGPIQMRIRAGSPVNTGLKVPGSINGKNVTLALATQANIGEALLQVGGSGANLIQTTDKGIRLLANTDSGDGTVTMAVDGQTRAQSYGQGNIVFKEGAQFIAGGASGNIEARSFGLMKVADALGNDRDADASWTVNLIGRGDIALRSSGFAAANGNQDLSGLSFKTAGGIGWPKSLSVIADSTGLIVGGIGGQAVEVRSNFIGGNVLFSSLQADGKISVITNNGSIVGNKIITAGDIEVNGSSIELDTAVGSDNSKISIKGAGGIALGAATAGYLSIVDTAGDVTVSRGLWAIGPAIGAPGAATIVLSAAQALTVQSVLASGGNMILNGSSITATSLSALAGIEVSSAGNIGLGTVYNVDQNGASASGNILIDAGGYLGAGSIYNSAQRIIMRANGQINALDIASNGAVVSGNDASGDNEATIDIRSASGVTTKAITAVNGDIDVDTVGAHRLQALVSAGDITLSNASSSGTVQLASAKSANGLVSINTPSAINVTGVTVNGGTIGIEAAGSIILQTAGGVTALGLSSTNGGITVNAGSGNLNVTHNVAARGNVDLRAGSLSAANVSSIEGDVFANAMTNSARFNFIQAGGNVRLTAAQEVMVTGAITASGFFDPMSESANVDIDSGGFIAVGSIATNGSIDLESHGVGSGAYTGEGIHVGALTSGQGIRLAAEAGDVTLDGAMTTSGNGISIAAGGNILGNTGAALTSTGSGDVVLQAGTAGNGSINFEESIASGGRVLITAPGTVFISDNVTAGGTEEGSGNSGTIDIRGASGNYILGNLAANNGDIYLSGDLLEVSGGLSSRGNIVVDTPGYAYVEGATNSTNGFVRFTSGDTVSTGNILAGGDIDVDAVGDILLGALTSAGDITLSNISGAGEVQLASAKSTAGLVSISSSSGIAVTGSTVNGGFVGIEAAGPIILQASGGITARGLSSVGGGVTAHANTDINIAYDVAALGDIDLRASNLRAANLRSIEGNVIANAVGDLARFGSVQAGGMIDLDATRELRVTGAITASGSTPSAGATIDLNSGGYIEVGSLTAANGSIHLESHGIGAGPLAAEGIRAGALTGGHGISVAAERGDVFLARAETTLSNGIGITAGGNVVVGTGGSGALISRGAGDVVVQAGTEGFGGGASIDGSILSENGRVVLTAAGTAYVSGNVTAGGTEQGTGSSGTIDIRGVTNNLAGNITATNGDIYLDGNSINVGGGLSSRGYIVLDSPGGISVGGATNSTNGYVHFTSDGSIETGDIHAGGAVDSRAGWGTITLLAGGMLFTGNVEASAAGVPLGDIYMRAASVGEGSNYGLTAKSLLAGGDVNVETAAGDLYIGDLDQGSVGNVQSRAGRVRIAAQAAGQNIEGGNVDAAGGVVVSSGGNITLGNVRNVAQGATPASGNVSIDAGGFIDMGSITAQNGTIALVSSGASLAGEGIHAGALIGDRGVSLSASAGDIYLTSAESNLSGGIGITAAGIVTVGTGNGDGTLASRGSGDVVVNAGIGGLGAIDVNGMIVSEGGRVVLASPGTVDVVGSITAGGAGQNTGNSGTIDIRGALGNSVGALSASNGDIYVNGAEAMFTGGLSSRGYIIINALGGIDVSGATNSANGYVHFTAGGYILAGDIHAGGATDSSISQGTVTLFAGDYTRAGNVDTAGDIYLRATDVDDDGYGISVKSLTAGGDIDVGTSGSLFVGDDAQGTLGDIESRTGKVSLAARDNVEAGTIDAAESVAVTAGAGSITAGDITNTGTGRIYLYGGDMQLGALDGAGIVEVAARGNIDAVSAKAGQELTLNAAGDLIISNSGNLQDAVSATGDVSLSGDNITIQNSGGIRSDAGVVAVAAVQGDIDANNISGAGRVTVSAPGDIHTGAIVSHAAATGGSEGAISINAGGAFSASGITADTGDVYISAGSDIETGAVGGNAGVTAISTGGDLQLASVNASAGFVTLQADGLLSVTGEIDARDDVTLGGTDVEIGGNIDAGSVIVAALEGIALADVTANSGYVDMQAGQQSGIGDIVAGAVSARTSITASGQGLQIASANSTLGSVSLQASDDLTVLGTVHARNAVTLLSGLTMVLGSAVSSDRNGVTIDAGSALAGGGMTALKFTSINGNDVTINYAGGDVSGSAIVANRNAAVFGQGGGAVQVDTASGLYVDVHTDGAIDFGSVKGANLNFTSLSSVDIDSVTQIGLVIQQGPAPQTSIEGATINVGSITSEAKVILGGGTSTSINVGSVNITGVGSDLLVQETGQFTSGSLNVSDEIHLLNVSHSTLGNVTANVLNLEGGQVGQQAGSVVAVNTLTGSADSVNLGGANRIGRIAGLSATGNVLVNDIDGGLTIAGALTSGGDIDVRTLGGNLTLESGAAVRGDNILLSTNRYFSNQAGASAVRAATGDDGAGNWLIYAAHYDQSQFGGLDSQNTAVWGQNVDSGAPGASGNRYVFAYRPTVTVAVKPGLTKTYGDTLTLGAAHYTVSGLEGGVAGAFAGDTLAGIIPGGIGISASGGTQARDNAGHYTVAINPLNPVGYAAVIQNGALDVLKRQVTVSATANNKTYDRTRVGSGSFGTVQNVAAGDDLSVAGGTFTFASSDAGTHQVDVTNITLACGNGCSADNYELVGPVRSTATINPLAITIDASIISKIYDGSTLASALLGGLHGVLAGDTVTASGGTFQYDNKNVGTGKTVSVSGIQLSSGNYIVNPFTVLGDITPRALTISIGADNKTYDGTANANGRITGIGGIVSGDDLNVSEGTYAFADKNAGNGKTVTASGIALSGSDSGNYVIRVAPSTVANILKKVVNVTIAAAGKTYDGTATAQGNVTGIEGVIAGDQLGTSGGAYAFSDKNAGNGKTVTGSGFQLTGADAANYQMAGPATAVADITKKVVTASVTANSKTYDGTATGTGQITVSGLIAGDTANVVGATYTFSDANAGTGKEVTVGGAALAGKDAQNYTLVVPTMAFADIFRRAVTVRANNLFKLVDTADPALTYRIMKGSLVAGDSFSGALERAPGEERGSYAIGQGSLSLSDNYLLTFEGGTFAVGYFGDPADPNGWGGFQKDILQTVDMGGGNLQNRRPPLVWEGYIDCPPKDRRDFSLQYPEGCPVDPSRLDGLVEASMTLGILEPAV